MVIKFRGVVGRFRILFKRNYNGGWLSAYAFGKVCGALAMTCVLFLGCSHGVSTQNAGKPNIVVIMADDLGFADLGCYGSEIPTPNLDALAKNGLRFSNFYNTGRCCPSRASLITGLYPHQAGMGDMTEDRGSQYPAYRGHLKNNTVTIAEVLRNAGYFTAMAGKWHLGQDLGTTPGKRGFDQSINSPAGGFFYGSDHRAKVFLNDEVVHSKNDTSFLGTDWYTTDLWTDYGLKFMDDARKANKPFFLYLAYNAPHFPLQAPEEEINRFRGKYMRGWDVIRKERYEKQKSLGIIGADVALSYRHPQVLDWDTLSEIEKRKYDDMMAIYAAMVTQMDKRIGDLVAELKALDEFENTLILFISDNGGNAAPGSGGRYEGSMPGTVASNIYLALEWTSVSDAPFWGVKRQVYEGGVASPAIISWPNGIPADMEGAIVRQPAHIIDIMPTLIDVAEAHYPDSFNHERIVPYAGISLKPAFSGSQVSRDEPIFWEHQGNRAIRDEKWKLVAGHREEWQLYDVEADPTERYNLYDTHTAVAKRLKERYEEWANEVHVEPFERKNPRWFVDYNAFGRAQSEK